jgi:hypothetical protein
MVAIMSAPFPIGPAVTDGWPMTSIIAGASTAPMAHAIDLARLFGGQGDNWSDALVSETRRQLGGCVNAVETGLRLTLEQDARVSVALGALPPTLVWPIVLSNPGMISPLLLAHMRMRAGLALLLRQVGHADLGDDAGEAGAAIHFSSDPDAVVRHAAIELAMAEGRWAMAGAEDQPIRPDVPAEQFFELIWMTAAALGAAVMRSGLVPGPVAMAAVQDAARAALTRHDEGQGALAVADRLVWRLGARADAPDLLGQALVERRHLLFAALAARHLRVETGRLAQALVAGPIGHVAAICHALGGSAPDYRHLLLALRPVRPTLSDARILGLTADYGAMSDEQADGVIAELRAPEELRAKMALLTPKAG